MKEIDESGDGKIQYEEFMQVFRSHEARYTINKRNEKNDAFDILKTLFSSLFFLFQTQNIFDSGGVRTTDSRDCRWMMKRFCFVPR